MTEDKENQKLLSVACRLFLSAWDEKMSAKYKAKPVSADKIPQEVKDQAEKLAQEGKLPKDGLLHYGMEIDLMEPVGNSQCFAQMATLVEIMRNVLEGDKELPAHLSMLAGNLMGLCAANFPPGQIPFEMAFVMVLGVLSKMRVVSLPSDIDADMLYSAAKDMISSEAWKVGEQVDATTEWTPDAENGDFQDYGLN